MAGSAGRGELRSGRVDVAEPLRQTLQAIAPFVAAGTLAQQDQVFRNVVDGIIAATSMRGLDAVRAALEQRAINAVFSGTEWLTPAIWPPLCPSHRRWQWHC